MVLAFPPWSLCRLKIKADAFLDSGAVDCFGDSKWAKKLRWPVGSLAQSRSITALDWVTNPVSLHYGS